MSLTTESVGTYVVFDEGIEAEEYAPRRLFPYRGKAFSTYAEAHECCYMWGKGPPVHVYQRTEHGWEQVVR